MAQGRSWQDLQVDDLARTLAFFWSSGPESGGSTSARGTFGGSTVVPPQGQGLDGHQNAEGRERYRPPHLRRGPRSTTSPSAGCEPPGSPQPLRCTCVYWWLTRAHLHHTLRHVRAVLMTHPMRTLFSGVSCVPPSQTSCSVLEPRRRTCQHVLELSFLPFHDSKYPFPSLCVLEHLSKTKLINKTKCKHE